MSLSFKRNGKSVQLNGREQKQFTSTFAQNTTILRIQTCGSTGASALLTGRMQFLTVIPFGNLLLVHSQPEHEVYKTELQNYISSEERLKRDFFDRGHPFVLILTNNIQYFPSDTTRLYIHKNVITGTLVSVSQNHLSDPPVSTL